MIFKILFRVNVLAEWDSSHVCPLLWNIEVFYEFRSKFLGSSKLVFCDTRWAVHQYCQVNLFMTSEFTIFKPKRIFNNSIIIINSIILISDKPWVLCYSKQRKIDAPSWHQSFDKAAVIFFNCRKYTAYWFLLSTRLAQWNKSTS